MLRENIMFDAVIYRKLIYMINKYKENNHNIFHDFSKKKNISANQMSSLFFGRNTKTKSIHLVLGIGRVQYASGLFACVDHHPYHRACQEERKGK